MADDVVGTADFPRRFGGDFVRRNMLPFLLIFRKTWRHQIITILFQDAFTVFLHEMLNLRQIIANVNALTLVEFCRLKYPHIMAAIVTEGH